MDIPSPRMPEGALPPRRVGDAAAPPLPVVAVPARDEEQRLPALLAALAGQSWCRRAGRALPVVVVLNNCVDASADAARHAAAALPEISLDLVEVELPPAQAHVGSARRLALDRASSRCGPGGVLLTTDADAVPDENWVEANLAAVAGGADLVGGFLRGDPDEEARLGAGFAARARAIANYARLCDRYAALVDPLAHDPWPRHHNHTGGSLAVRSDLYRAVGGLPALPRREDVAFVSLACAAGGRLAHPLDVRVTVSARLAGRAKGGMADCLKAWMRAEAEGAPILVRDPRQWGEHLRRRKEIRDLGRVPGAVHAGAEVKPGPPPPALWRTDPDAVAGALVARHAPEEPDPPQTVPVTVATALLLTMIGEHEGTDRAA